MMQGHNKVDAQLRQIKGRSVLVIKQKIPTRKKARSMQAVRAIKRDIADVFGK